MGLFSFAAASIARKGQTVAVEADLWLAQLIRKSSFLKENRGLNIQLLPCAIADKNGVAAFLIARRSRATNSLETISGRSLSGGVREKATVPTLTLDTLLDFFHPPTFLKVDVEGAEAIVLKGASRILADIRPTIYIEVGSEANTDVTAVFMDNGYLLFDGGKPLQEQSPRCSCTFDTLAMPQESRKPV